jgi:hypothetical protein
VMLLESLVEQCERGLRVTYSVRLAHVHVLGARAARPGVSAVAGGWTWHLDIATADGGIVHAAHTIRGACVRAASNMLTIWLETFTQRNATQRNATQRNATSHK